MTRPGIRRVVRGFSSSTQRGGHFSREAVGAGHETGKPMSCTAAALSRYLALQVQRQ